MCWVLEVISGASAAARCVWRFLRRKYSAWKEVVLEKMRPTVGIGPPKRPTQIASYANVSIGAPGVAALLQDVTNSEATISEGLGTSQEDTIGSPANMDEPTTRRQWRMDWQEKSRFPSK